MSSLNDLNSISWFWLTLSRLTAKERSIEPRSNCICSTHQVCFTQRIQSLRRALWWQQEGALLFLLGSVSHHGFCAAYSSGELARHRSLSGRPGSQALSRRLQWPNQTLYSCRCQRDARLAYLSRLCPKPDPNSTSSLCVFRTGQRTRCDRLCFGRHYHRPLPLALSLGHIQEEQRRDQTAHANGDSQRYSCIYRHYSRLSARDQSARCAGARTRLVHRKWTAATSISSVFTGCKPP
jgi:hypothetical protein